jgi:hypothetical protein
MSEQLTAVNPRVARYFLVVGSVLGLAFSLINEPAEAGLLGGLKHLLQWQLQTLIPVALLMALQMLVLKVPRSFRGGPWISLLVTGLMASMLFAPLGLWIDHWFLDDPLTVEQLVDEFAGLAPPVILCWVAMNAPLVLGLRWDPPSLKEESQQAPVPPPTASAQAEPDQPDFFREIPADIRSDMVYLKAELHYLSVVTTSGRALILYNLRDAVAQLPSELGTQTHRSYWVALPQVVALHRSGRQGELELSNGDRVPVSRTRLAVVREALESP